MMMHAHALENLNNGCVKTMYQYDTVCSPLKIVHTGKNKK